MSFGEHTFCIHIYMLTKLILRLTGPFTLLILLTMAAPPVTHNPFKSTIRGDQSHPSGYLAEGGNVLIEKKTGMVIKAFSANDFVGRYGIYLDYLPAGENLKSTFKPVIDQSGELIDFASTMNLRELLDATWLGRPQLEYAPDGKLWMKFHFVPIQSIPPGFPVEGWPTPEQFVGYGRIAAEAPVKIVFNSDGVPHLELDIDPK